MLALIGDCLRKDGPLACDEISEFVGVPLLTLRPRMSDLKRNGIVHLTGERRPTWSGREADVLKYVKHSI